MARYGWFIREIIINGNDYRIGEVYNTPTKGYLTLQKIDATNQELVFMDKDNNFFNIPFIEFI